MNLAFVVHRYSPSEGTGGYVVRLVERLAVEHDITVYAAERGVDVPAGVRFVRVPAVRRPASATILTFPLGFALRRKRHDLVHAQGWVTGRADVVTAHIVMRAWLNAIAGSGAPRALGERLVGPAVAANEVDLFKTARTVIAPSRGAAQNILDLGIDAAKVHVVPHGFPQPWYPDQAASRAVLGLPAGPLALFAGDARKNLHVVLEALSLVPETHLVVSSFSDRTYWLDRATRMGVSSRVHWLGAQQFINMALAAADLLVHPTPYDTFGLVIAEAMAAGRPAIATRAAGITELYGQEAGWILPSANASALADAWRSALDPAQRGARGDTARAVAATRPWEAVVATTLAVYGSLR
ncbi:MAG: glycosyltransferase family 4 protein [Gemmatimonadales bacterium]